MSSSKFLISIDRSATARSASWVSATDKSLTDNDVAEFGLVLTDFNRGMVTRLEPDLLLSLGFSHFELFLSQSVVRCLSDSA